MATTEESTPPESPQTTCPSPTFSRQAATALSMNAAIFQSPLHPQTARRKLRRMSLPSGVCETSGWNCTP